MRISTATQQSRLARITLRRIKASLLAAVLATLLVTVLVASSHSTSASAVIRDPANPPPCARAATSQPPPVKPTTIATLQQVYWCIFAHYYSGPVLDDRTLLVSAFAALTQELERRGIDQPTATLPALTGSRPGDWIAFSARYRTITDALPNRPQLRQELAATTLKGMLAGLNDNHVNWAYPYQPGVVVGLGITTSPSSDLMTVAAQETVPPLFVTSVVPGTPAARHGLQPGDVIGAVNGASPFTDGVLSPGVVAQLADDSPVRLRLYRPSTDQTWTVTMTPTRYTAPEPVVHSKVLRDSVAYIQLPAFLVSSAAAVLNAISASSKATHLRGVVLDVRGNGGGSPYEVAKLLGAFVHGKAWSYDCDVAGTCTANYTDDSVSLLHLPLVLLTDRNCASACDAFSGAVKDLHLGTLVGTRTSGLVAGPAGGYLLDDNSLLLLPAQHEVGARKEIINGIGVAPDYYLPLTATDLSNRRDPDIQKALTLLES